MKYTLDVSGDNQDGTAAIDRFGGLFISIEDAVTHGKRAAKKGRFSFVPKFLWVRNEEGEVMIRDSV